MDRARFEGPVERDERRRLVDRSAPRVREPRPLQLGEHPEQSTRSHLGDPAVVRHGAAARATPEHDATGATSDRDPAVVGRAKVVEPLAPIRDPQLRDRKSTRLNSSHMSISYAVFCLKKKKKT